MPKLLQNAEVRKKWYLLGEHMFIFSRNLSQRKKFTFLQNLSLTVQI